MTDTKHYIEHAYKEPLRAAMRGIDVGTAISAEQNVTIIFEDVYRGVAVKNRDEVASLEEVHMHVNHLGIAVGDGEPNDDDWKLYDLENRQ